MSNRLSKSEPTHSDLKIDTFEELRDTTKAFVARKIILIVLFQVAEWQMRQNLGMVIIKSTRLRALHKIADT